MNLVDTCVLSQNSVRSSTMRSEENEIQDEHSKAASNQSPSHNSLVIDDEIRTIFLTGLPEDVSVQA